MGSGDPARPAVAMTSFLLGDRMAHWSRVRWVLAALALLLGVTLGSEWVYSRLATQDEGVAQARAVQVAERQVRERFVAVQADMDRYARSVAEQPALISALREAGAAGALASTVAQQRTPARRSLGIYDRDGVLLGWDGVSLKPSSFADYAHNEARWGTARDGTWRQFLELWYPVKDSQRVVGQVRLLDLLSERTPVQNEYLQDYHISREWSREVGLQVTTTFGEGLPEAGSHALEAPDGRVVGSFTVAVPSLRHIRQEASRKFRDIAALWVLLLLATGFYGLWRRYRRSPSLPRVALLMLYTVAARYLLLPLGIPGRWQTGKAPLSPLFDATHLASTLGGGFMHTAGDFMVSALCCLGIALVLLHYAQLQAGGRRLTLDALRPRSLVQLVRSSLAVLVGLGLLVLLGMVSRRMVLDSTIDYFSREAFLPEPMTLVLYGALAISALSALLAVSALIILAQRAHRSADQGKPSGLHGVLLLALVVTGALASDQVFQVPWILSLAFLAAGGAAAHFRVGASFSWLSLRGVLLGTLVVSTLVYPLFFAGLSERRHIRMEHAAATFDRGYDASIAFALRDLMDTARTDSSIIAALTTQNDHVLYDLAVALRHGTLLASRGAFFLELHFFDSTRMHIVSTGADTTGLGTRLANAKEGATEVVASSSYEPGRAYDGVAHVTHSGKSLGWVVARAMPQVLPQEANTPLLRMLLPSGYRDLLANLSIASFQDGLLRSSIGRSFRHTNLEADVTTALADTSVLWRLDAYGDRRYEAFYERRAANHVVGVRARTIATFDHLYYLLQLIIAGLLVGLTAFAVGLVLRRAAGRLPARHVRFQDKMLNAFLVMAILAVIPVGVVGVRVVTEESTKAIQSWLRNHLHSVEVALAAEAQPGEPTYRVLERTNIDSLASQVGLDLNVYEGPRLYASSRPRLVQERLIDGRIPVNAYAALHADGFKFTSVAQQLGSFGYTAGYHALLDEHGTPQYVLSVPTLPEQERIEEERARTLSYLFGALMAIMALVMLTASFLASALARPIASLQLGLQAVARGQHERRLSVETRDEVGELAQTFNTMQRQLAENRRQLATQERQLAWREMARQVAHEIKNPLTPMKLSVQHLQRAHTSRSADTDGRFDGLFKRITSALVKEMDALAHIANEFATFARMPDRIVEPLDLGEVIQEAAELMEEEAPAGIDITVQLPGPPLIVEADRKELKRIYINLIKNALEAMREDESGSLSIALRQEGEFARSAVRDTGCGIDPDLQDKIFEPSFSTKTSGAGLGLAIARRSIEAIGGTIGFETKVSEGTEFYIELPVSH